MKRRILIVPIAIAALIAAWLVLGPSGKPKAAGRERVARGTVSRKAIAVGRIEVPFEVPVNSPTGGILTKLFVVLGERVEKGQPLAEVRPIVTEGQLLQAELALEQARRGEESAREYLEGQHLASGAMRLMLGKKNIERMYRTAQEGRRTAEENLEMLRKGEVDVGGRKVDSIIRAPVAGHVIEIRQREGAPVVPSSTYGTGSMFLTLADLGQLIFRGTVDEIDVGRLKEGMAARLKVGALPGTVLDGKLVEIGLKAGERNNAVVFDVRIALDGPPPAVLRSGYAAVADIEVERREGVLVLPERLVEFRGGRSFVGIPDGRGGRAEKEVRTGLGDGLVVEVLDGLAEGDEVVEKAVE
jgi:HlyD family secretion protein